MEFDILKGTKDYPPKEQIQINKIFDIMRKNFELFGFRPFDSPIIEFFDTLAMKYDESAEIVQEIFKVKDRGDRQLGLRYDLTTPLSRFFAINRNIKKPFRRYHIGKVFRDGPIKSGRLREFTQCDCDVIGDKDTLVDAELLLLYTKVYKELGINAVIEINNNKILKGAFMQSGFDQKDIQKLILSVDKLKKIGVKGVLCEIKANGFDVVKAELAINLLNSKDIEELRSLATNEQLLEGIDELSILKSAISTFCDFRINFSMARGLAIYTGNIWEVYDKDETITSSIGGGGRYDNIIGEYAGLKENEKVYAVGISFGLIPILACLEAKEEKNTKEGVTDLLIVPLNNNLSNYAFTLAEKYRQNNINTEIYYGYKLNKAFEYAQYLGCLKMAIIGEQDSKNNIYTLKDINTGEQEKINMNNIKMF